MTVTRERWLHGACPCCGEERDNDGLDGAGPAVIGEGVWVCGWCERHHHVGDTVAVILAEILEPA